MGMQNEFAIKGVLNCAESNFGFVSQDGLLEDLDASQFTVGEIKPASLILTFAAVEEM